MGVSVIVPVYNGEKFIADSLKRLHKFLTENYKDFEIIVVDDGSKDKTCEIVSTLQLPGVNIISYKINRGKGFAIRKGFFHAKYNVVIFTDCDLPYSFNTLQNLIFQLESGNCDLGICSRTLTQSRIVINYQQVGKFFLRWLFGRIVNLGMRFLLGIPYKDTQAGTKGFNKMKLNNIMEKCFINRWAFDCEIIYLCYKNNMKISEIPAYQEFSVEESTVKFLDGIQYFIDVLRIFIVHKMGFAF